MRTRTRHLFIMASALALVLVTHSAYAFYPLGAFSTQSQELVVPKWPLSYMDTNHDGDVSGPNEGIPITFESGGLGYSMIEQNIIKSAFKTWSDVPTAFIGFRYTDPVPNLPDGLELSADIGSMDFFNYVAKQTTSDTQVLPTGLAGITYITSTVEATRIYIENTPYDINGGTILDVDILISESMVKTNLKGVATILIGYMLGLQPSPMDYNLYGLYIRNAGSSYPISFFLPDPAFTSLTMWEFPDIQLRDASGQLKNFGVTPTMFPQMYYYIPGPVLYPTTLSADYAYVAGTKSDAEIKAGLSTLPLAKLQPFLTNTSGTHTFQNFAGQNGYLLNQANSKLRLKVAENFPADLWTGDLFTTYTVDGSARVYSVGVRSEDALGLRLQVDLATLRAEEELWVVDPTVDRAFGPFTRITGEHSKRWLPSVEGDTIDIIIRTTGPNVPNLSIEQGSHGFRPLQDAAKELSCHVNVACETSVTIQKLSTAIGLIYTTTEEGSFVASGSLVNNPDTAAFEPYFLTANHVVGDITEALASEIFWDYRIATCKGVSPPDIASVPRSAVTQLLATLQPIDATLLGLDTVPVGSLGRAYLGWDIRVPSVKDGENRFVNISHPAGTHMRIAKGKVDSVANEVLVDEFGPTMGMIGVEFDSGIVEPGSSGSPLLADDTTFHVMGMLSNALSDQDCTTTPPKANYSSFRDFFPFIAGYLTGTPAPEPEDRCGQEGHADLAPDDIAGITYLYPRKGEDIFFNVAHEARTHNNGQTLPSVPIAGGLVIAWCDTDNDPSTSRVPLYTTLSSLYQIQTATRGRFDEKGLLKQLETSSAGLFDATYTFTVSPIYSPLWLYLTLDPKSFDSTHGGSSLLGGSLGGLPGFSFSSGYPSEVFNEHGNIFDADREEEGTPLKYDRIRRKVVSADSNRTLDAILPGTTPMFGDGVSNCPYAVASVGLSSTKGPDALRTIRDRYLLNSAAGAALVDLYYHVGPSLANYLTTHATAWRIAHAAAAGVEWILSHVTLSLGSVAFAVVALVGGLRIMRRRSLRRLALLLALSAPFVLSRSADAQLLRLTNEQMVAAANDIVTGEVVAVDSHWNDHKQIVTDVSIKVTDVIKGKTNKDGNVSLTVPGGRVGAISTVATFMPTFAPQQKVVVFLENPRLGTNVSKSAAASPLVVGGTRGKLEITEDPVTKAAYVSGSTAEAQMQLAAARAALPEQVRNAYTPNTAKSNPVADTKISLADYTAYLRSIVASQEGKKAAK